MLMCGLFVMFTLVQRFVCAQHTIPPLHKTTNALYIWIYIENNFSFGFHLSGLWNLKWENEWENAQPCEKKFIWNSVKSFKLDENILEK